MKIKDIPNASREAIAILDAFAEAIARASLYGPDALALVVESLKERYRPTSGAYRDECDELLDQAIDAFSRFCTSQIASIGGKDAPINH